jgi:uncharacterized RDD family membrane protein YckC
MTVAQQPVRGIVTPEAVLLELELAGLPSRALAQAIDSLVKFGLFMLVGVVIQLVGTAAGSVPTWVAIAAFTVLSALVLFGYPIACETLWNGRTPGKAALGLRVVTAEGAPIRFRHAAVRGLLLIIDAYVPPVGVAGAITMVANRQNQRLGDLAAGTIVLRERSGATPAVAVAFPPPPGLEAYAAGLDVSAVTEQQYAVLRSFLTRVFELSAPARARLSVRLANPIARRMNHTPPAGVGPEIFLVCVVAAYQRLHGGPATWALPYGLRPGSLPPPWWGQPPPAWIPGPPPGPSLHS